MGGHQKLTTAEELHALFSDPARLKSYRYTQVWSLTQFFSVDFSKSRINVKKCVYNKRTIKVCVSCC